MKFSLSWLKTHLDTQHSLSDILYHLTDIGLEVEEVFDPAPALGPFEIVHVVEARPHPDADRLKVCQVKTKAGTVQIVCGAPNCVSNMRAVMAPPGSTVPGTGLTLKKTAIRGQESNGMLVSEEELDLPVTQDGIIRLPDDAPIGENYARWAGLDDPVITINLTPNRADCAGVRGIARDLAARGLGTLLPLQRAMPVRGEFPSPFSIHLAFDKQTSPACPHFMGRLIKGVRNGPSPEWLQRRLRMIGLRPISALVDITNFLTHDLNRPLHVFDADRVIGNMIIRHARVGETLQALNEKSYALDERMCVICDDTGVISLGGVIGGLSTGCTEKTENVIIECAYFDPFSIVRTGRALQVNSDARYRFERGIDPAFTATGMDIATQLVLEICGGKPGDIVTAGEAPVAKRIISYPPSRLKQLTGMHVEREEQQKILSALGFGIQAGNHETWQISPPGWRGDVEGAADITEEIARIKGYASLPEESAGLPTDTTASFHMRQPLTRIKSVPMRNLLAARGFQECVSWSFLSATLATLFANGQKNVAIANPISADLDTLRPSIIPVLLQMARKNQDRGFPAAAFFEAGPVFTGPSAGNQFTMLSAIRVSTPSPRHWQGDAKAPDFYSIKADMIACLETTGVKASSMPLSVDGAPAFYHPGRKAALVVGTHQLAHMGEVHPAILEEFGLDHPVLAFEINLNSLADMRVKSGGAAFNASVFQPVVRDFAFIMDDDVPVEVLMKAIRQSERIFISQIRVFDVYRGKGVDNGKKSVAVEVTLQPHEKTLTDQEIDDISRAIIAAAAAKAKAKLRAA